MRTLGEVLVDRLGLQGLFGVDGVIRGGEFWPVEFEPAAHGVDGSVGRYSMRARTLPGSRRCWRASQGRQPR
ncbi:MAG: hypothetical protein U0797_08455 [Gemmataceae bacterium]